MKLPLSLLKNFIDLNLPISTIAETLTLLGIEVDGIEQEQPPFSRVVVGEVLSVRPHPQAGKLRIAEVSDGTQTVQVVCGAPNCRAGLKTAFAQVGAVLIDREGKKMRIEKAVLRGEESLGMLCAVDELGLAGDGAGIMELPAEWVVGEDLLPLLWDPVFELSLTPNLGHCLSARGIARELSAALNIPLKPIAPAPKINKPSKIRVDIEAPHLCLRYLGRLIENVKIGPSPFWLRKTLESAGMRPINNGVDITNYILLKWGQPLHAFDADLLNEASLIVTTGKENQPFQCLDGIERTPPDGTLLIADPSGPIALAGIMGGASTAVTDKTKRIFLEAASFDPMAIRISSKKMGLRSESSQRFEKGVDPEAIPEALADACRLFEEMAGGELESGAVDLSTRSFEPKQISCRYAKIKQILGVHLSINEVVELFRRLGFETTLLPQEVFEVQIPLYRFDLFEEIDLIEEVARIYGYNKIERPAPRCTTSQIPHDPKYVFETKVRTLLAAAGLQEWITCDLLSPKLADLAVEERLPGIQFLKALHFKSEEYSILRPSLLPGFLQCALHNLDQKNHSFSGFEIGRIHFAEGEKMIEFPMAGLLLCGKIAPHHWDRKPESADFYDLKGIVENLLAGLHATQVEFTSSRHPSFHPGRQASLVYNEMIIGSLGEVHPALLKKLDIKEPILYAELNLSLLAPLSKKQVQMKPLPQFPSSERDWTIPLPPAFPLQTVWAAIEAVRSPLLASFELIDLFAAEKKNATFRFTYRDSAKTLAFEEVEKEHARLVQAVEKSLEEKNCSCS